MTSRVKLSSTRMEKLADRQFDPTVTARERAIFEGAISLGALYHQFVGVPIPREPKHLRLLERAIEESMKRQPYKKDVQVHINDALVKGESRNPFDYTSLDARALEARVISEYQGWRATVEMRYIPELEYNLMFIERVQRAAKQRKTARSQ